MRLDVVFSFLILYCVLLAMTKRQSQFHILAFGDSLTAGYYNHGRNHHPYARYLTDLFQTANISVQIAQRGVSGELAVPTMVTRLRHLLTTDVSYDWVIILGGTNDLAGSTSAKNIFELGLKPMYEMCLNHPHKKINLVAMTVIENMYDLPTNNDDEDRQALNTMIRDFVANSTEQDRICLVDLDKGIPYHTASNDKERQYLWDDGVHLTPAGYDLMATLIFDAMKSKL